MMSEKQKSMQQFLDVSTVHGLSYISDRSSKTSEKIFWILILVLSAIVFFLLMHSTTEKFLADQIVIKLSEKRVSVAEVPFPAVTICPEFIDDEGSTLKRIESFTKIVQKSKNSDFVELLNMLDDLKFFERTNASILSILDKNAQLKWMKGTLGSIWRTRFGVPFNLILTKWGFCFNFNMLPVSELLHMNETSTDFHYVGKYYSYFKNQPILSEPAPWKVSQASRNLEIELYYIAFFISFNPFKIIEGYRVMIHGTDEFPNDSSYSFFYHTKRTVATISPELILLSDELKVKSSEKRNCFFNHEKSLKYFKVYNKENCQQECLSLKISAACGCVPFYLIRAVDDQVCEMKQRKCYEKVVEEVNSDQNACKCLERCEQVKYQTKLEYTEGYGIIEIEVKFADNTFQPLLKAQSFLFSDYLGSVGGIMGLIAGVSVLSLIEFVYHVSSLFHFKVKALIASRKVSIETKRPIQRARRKFNEDHALYFLTKYVGKYMNISDIHGFKNIVNRDDNALGKLFWASAVIISFIACCILTSYAYTHADTNPVATKIDDHVMSIEEIPFPAVTYCSSAAEEIYLKHRNCNQNRSKEISDQKTDNEREHMCDLNSVQLKWLEDQSFCYGNKHQLMTKQTLTHEGVCFTFNTDVFNELRNEIISEDFSMANDLKLNCKDETQLKRTLTIDLSDENPENYVTPLGTVMIQKSNTYPHANDRAISPKMLMTFIVNPIITTADESLRNFSPERRNCFFDDEKNLKFFKKYSHQNCLTECKSNATLELCGCMEFFDIRDKTTKVCDTEVEKSCAKQISLTLYDENSKFLEACNCLDDCNKIVYDFDLTTENLRHDETMKSDIATVQVRFGDDQYIAYKLYATHGTVELLSVVGGLLGLFLGISVLSIVEFFYFFVLRFITDLWWNEQRH